MESERQLLASSLVRIIIIHSIHHIFSMEQTAADYASDRAGLLPSIDGATATHPGPGNLYAPSLLAPGQVLASVDSEKVVRLPISECRSELFNDLQS